MKLRNLLTMVLALIMCLGVAMPAWAAEDGMQPYAHDMEYKQVLIDSDSVYGVKVGFVPGQPANGTTFTSPGGFYWQDGGNKVDVSVSVNWGVISVGISAGSLGGIAEYISAPTNKPCKLFLYKDVLIKRYETFERLIGTTTWHSTGYKEAVETIGYTLEVRYGRNFSQVYHG